MSKYPRIKPRYIIDEDGNKTHVILDMKSYESMIGRMEEWAKLLNIKAPKSRYVYLPVALVPLEDED